MFYNLTENKFTDRLPDVNLTDFLRVERCSHAGRETIVLISFNDEPLCLHNESENEEEAVRLFKEQDESFKKHLDFFEY